MVRCSGWIAVTNSTRNSILRHTMGQIIAHLWVTSWMSSDSPRCSDVSVEDGATGLNYSNAERVVSFVRTVTLEVADSPFRLTAI